MEEFKNSLAELLEVDNVNEDDLFESFDAWDSLTILSILAYADEEFNINITAQELMDSKTIIGLYDLIKSRQKQS